MHDNLFDHVDIKEQNVHIPSARGTESEIQAQCNAYNEALKKANIDIQLLGIGSNGHIAFNEPGTSFEQETFIIELTPIHTTEEFNLRFGYYNTHQYDIYTDGFMTGLNSGERSDLAFMAYQAVTAGFFHK